MAVAGASNPGPPGATPVVARIFLGIVRLVQTELSECAPAIPKHLTVDPAWQYYFPPCIAAA